jgi:hypothetical protein
LRLGAKAVETANARANKGAIRILSDAIAAAALAAERAPAPRHTSMMRNAAAADAAIIRAAIDSARQNQR